MRAVIVVGDYPMPGQTFVNRHIEHLFGGNTCIVCNHFGGQNPSGKPVFARRAVQRSWLDRARGPFARAGNKLVHGTSRRPFGAHRRALLAFLAAQRPDLILGEFGTETLGIFEVAQALGIPCFSYFRGMDASAALEKKSRVAGYRRMFPTLAGIISVSRFLLDQLAARGLTHENAHVIPSGVDVRRFAPGPKVPSSFLSVGRMVEKKAPLLTLEAFAAATGDRPEARLRVIGDGPLLEPARARARSLGIAERVRFDGALPHQAVRAALAETEVFLQHSLTAADGNTEGLPTSIQEALASGCLVVSTRHAGIPEAVEHGRNGWLSAEGDGDGFAALIARSQGTRAEAMRRAARRTAEARFDNARLLGQLEEVLRAAV